MISSFSETKGGFLYFAVNYLNSTNIVSSVADGGVDNFSYVGGEYANSSSVAFYDVATEHGGTVNISVTVSATTFGTCRAGQLGAGTRVGTIGAGNSTASGTTLDLTNAASNEPSLLFALIGSSRPSGSYTMSTPAGNWLTGGQQGTGYNPGTQSALYAYNDTSAGSQVFAFLSGSSVSISGISVEFYFNSMTDFPVSFVESGLSAGTNWSVLFNDRLFSSNTSQILFAEPNGTYLFTVASVPGFASNVTSARGTVAGAMLTVDVRFTPVEEYLVTVRESGLPIDTAWSVLFNGSVLRSSTPQIQLVESNGTYTLLVGSVPGYAPNVTSELVVVSGSSQTVDVSFVPQGEYAITFLESGLVAGSNWSVVFNGVPIAASIPMISFIEPNGSYPFSIATEPGYWTSVVSGVATVVGFPQSISVTFSPTAVGELTIEELGLPVGTNWSVILNGTVSVSTATTIVVAEPFGTYPYSIPSLPGFFPVVSSGQVVVSASTEPLIVKFSATKQFAVSFVESGLSADTSWSVTLNGTLGVTTSNVVLFSEPSGVYSFAIGAVKGQTPNVGAGRLWVNGTATTYAVSFSPYSRYAVIFEESGLPGGTNWSVVLNGSLLTSQSSLIIFGEPNGSYPFSVGGVSGYGSNVSAGQVGVSGSTRTVYLNFSSAPASVGASGSSPNGGTLEWALLGVVAGFAVGVGVTRMMRRGRRPDSGTSLPEEELQAVPPEEGS